MVAAGDVIDLLLGSYLLLPLAALYAFPKRQSVWLVPVFAAPIAVAFWGSRVQSELEPLVFVSVALAAVTVPVVMLVRGLSQSRLKKWLIVTIVLVLGCFGFMATVFYVGEADLHPDEYCWRADRGAGPCQPSPWLLGPSAIAAPTIMLVIVGSVPVSLLLLWYGWKRRRAERTARSA
jgi:hypothetical protein